VLYPGGEHTYTAADAVTHLMCCV